MNRKQNELLQLGSLCTVALAAGLWCDVCWDTSVQLQVIYQKAAANSQLGRIIYIAQHRIFIRPAVDWLTPIFDRKIHLRRGDEKVRAFSCTKKQVFVKFRDAELFTGSLFSSYSSWSDILI